MKNIHTTAAKLMIVVAFWVFGGWNSEARAIGRETPGGNPVPGNIVVNFVPANFDGMNYVGTQYDSAGCRGNFSHSVNICYDGYSDPPGTPTLNALLQQTQIKTIRFPGGVVVDMYDYRCPYWLGNQTPQFGSSTHWFNLSTSSVCPGSRQIDSWGLASLPEVWQFASSLGGHLLLQTSVVDAAGGVVTRQDGVTALSPSDPMAIAELARESLDYIGSDNVDFEIGNEPETYFGVSGNCEALTGVLPDGSGKTYIQKFVEQANAIHLNNPSARVIGPATTNFSCLKVFLRELSRVCRYCLDGVSVHYYPPAGTWDSLIRWSMYWKTGLPYDSTGSIPNMPAIRVQLQVNGFDPDLPVLVTEWNQGVLLDIWGENSATTMQGALLYIDYMVSFATSGVDTETYYSMHDARPGKPGDPGGYTGGMFTGLGDLETFGDPIDSPMPTYYAERIWSKLGRMLISRRNSSDYLTFIYAVNAQGKYQVLLSDKSGSDQSITISEFPISGFPAVGSFSGVTIDTLTPANGSRSDEVVWPGGYYSSVSGSSYTYMLHANSIALLTFQ